MVSEPFYSSTCAARRSWLNDATDGAGSGETTRVGTQQGGSSYNQHRARTATTPVAEQDIYIYIYIVRLLEMVAGARRGVLPPPPTRWRPPGTVRCQYRSAWAAVHSYRAHKHKERKQNSLLTCHGTVVPTHDDNEAHWGIAKNPSIRRATTKPHEGWK